MFELFEKRPLVRKPNLREFQRSEDVTEVLKKEIFHIKGRLSLMDRKLNRLCDTMENLQRILEHQLGFHIENGEVYNDDHPEEEEEEETHNNNPEDYILESIEEEED